MGSVLLVVVLVVGGVFGFFVLMRRLSRSLLDRKEEALVASLTAAGATRKGTKLGGLYEGNDVAFELAGTDVLVNARYDSRSLVRVGLLVKTGFLPWAVFSAEKGMHHLGKKLGISRELQTGDAAFDQHCYVDSPEPDDVVKRVLADDSAREAISGLIALGFHVQTSTRGVEAFQLAPLHERRREIKAAEATALLARLAKAVPQFEGLEFRTPGEVRNLPLAALVVLFAAGGLFGALALEATLGVTVNRAAALAGLIGGGFALWALGVALLSVVARGSSDGMRALAFSAAVTLVGLPGLGGTLVLAANQRLDGAQPTVHQVKVRSTDSKAVQVDSWEPGAPAVRVEASYGALQKFAVGDVVPVKVHPGALGLTWVERLDAEYGWGL